jgi:hypothetical protein
MLLAAFSFDTSDRLNTIKLQAPIKQSSLVDMLFAFVSAPNNNMRDVAKNEHPIRNFMIQYYVIRNRNGFSGRGPLFFIQQKQKVYIRKIRCTSLKLSTI